MKRLSCCLMTLAMIGATATLAHAQAAAPAAAPENPPPAPMGARPLVGATTGYFTATALGGG